MTPVDSGWRHVVSFFVPGTPRPGGSKTATVIRRKGGQIVMTAAGRPLITMRDDGGEKTADWKRNVAYFARGSYSSDPIPRGVPIRLEVTFVMPRCASHFGTGKNAGRLKASAPAEHVTKPDLSKITRSTEDALTGIIWADDAAISLQVLSKVYGAKVGAHIAVSVKENA
jgi:Holliday junction resolvase RusA-like endonuclease